MTSRYVMDFAAPVAAGLAAAVWLIAREGERQSDPSARAWIRGTIAGGIGLWLWTSLATGWISPTHAARPLVTLAEVRSQMPAPADSGPTIPSAYRCGEDPGRSGVPFNGIGWDATGDCRVQAVTTLFMTKPDCLAITAAGDTRDVQIKYGVTLLDRAGPLTFCPPSGFRPNPTGIEIVSIAWVQPESAVLGPLPLRLDAIKKP
jgi:hypothetical protein